MEINIKKLNDLAEIPKYQTEGAACFDLVATSMKIDRNNNQIKYGIGLAFEIPKGYKGNLYPRSSIVKTSLRLGNCTGIIDSDYRGEVSLVFDILENSKLPYYAIGERIGQMEIVPVLQVKFKESKELSETVRGSGGYGSTNTK